MGTREWESLLPELLSLIFKQLQTLQDSIRFGCVCKSWRSVSSPAVLNIFNKNLPPLLIVPYDKGDGHKKKERKRGSTICDDTLGAISLFHTVFHTDDHDHDHDNELNKNKEIFKLFLPEIENRRICGCSEGWLVTFHENSEIQLLNPISRVVVHLPPVTTFPEIVGTVVSEEKGLCYIVKDCYLEASYYKNHPEIEPHLQEIDSHEFREYFLQKVVTNTDANNSTLPTVVMAIYGGYGTLAFCRPSGYGIVGGGGGGDRDDYNKWISCFEGDTNCYRDITFYNGNFYAVECSGSVVVVKGLDGTNSSPFITTIIKAEYNSFFGSQAVYYPNMKYLVESYSSSGGGDLLIVIRRRLTKEEESSPYRTFEFKVFKLDFNGPSWVKVTNLGEDCALFVGYNHSFSFSTSKFPGCKGNCIYFTDDNYEDFYKGEPIGGHDMGVYNLEDGSFETLYETSSQILLPPPIWYELKNKNGFVEQSSNL